MEWQHLMQVLEFTEANKLLFVERHPVLTNNRKEGQLRKSECVFRGQVS